MFLVSLQQVCIQYGIGKFVKYVFEAKQLMTYPTFKKSQIK